MDWFVEFFKYATSGFWVFVGCAMLLGIVGNIFLRLVIIVLRIFK